MKFPEVTHLYKYCSYNSNSLSILINEKIWAATPVSFNDPLDCNLKFNPDISTDCFNKYILNKIQDRGEDFKNHIEKKLQDHRKESNEVLSLLYDELESFRSDTYKKFGVFSMSQINDNILMWSHYADQHRGFCIELVRSPDNYLGNDECTGPVNYPTKYPVIDPINSEGQIDPSLKKIMLYSKSEDWNYEKEWRMIYQEGDTLNQLPADISAIIFGLRMPNSHMDTIKNILKERTGIRFKKAELAEYQFKLEIVDNG